jgi:hypothetical protein
MIQKCIWECGITDKTEFQCNITHILMNIYSLSYILPVELIQLYLEHIRFKGYVLWYNIYNIIR